MIFSITSWIFSSASAFERSSDCRLPCTLRSRSLTFCWNSRPFWFSASAESVDCWRCSASRSCRNVSSWCEISLAYSARFCSICWRTIFADFEFCKSAWTSTTMIVNGGCPGAGAEAGGVCCACRSPITPPSAARKNNKTIISGASPARLIDIRTSCQN